MKRKTLFSKEDSVESRRNVRIAMIILVCSSLYTLQLLCSPNMMFILFLDTATMHVDANMSNTSHWHVIGRHFPARLHFLSSFFAGASPWFSRAFGDNKAGIAWFKGQLSCPPSGEICSLSLFFLMTLLCECYLWNYSSIYVCLLILIIWVDTHLIYILLVCLLLLKYSCMELGQQFDSHNNFPPNLHLICIITRILACK